MADQDLTFAGLGFDLGTAQEINKDVSFTVPRAYDTVPTSAIGSLTPVTPNAAADSSWAGYFRDLTKTIVGYEIVKDAQRSGVQSPTATTQPVPAKQAQTPAQSLMPLLLIGAVIFAVVKLAE